MKRLFSGLLLLLVSGFAIAGDATGSVGGSVNPVTDLSQVYLSQIFGTVGNVLQGTTGQMLGMLFAKLNEGVMVVASLWLVYTVFTIVMRSAMDGSFMGQNKNVFWIIIRIGMGFSLLIPSPTTGYNVIQDMVMKVVVAGVKLADTTWSYGLDYIQNGGTLWLDPHSNNDGSGLVTLPAARSLYGNAQSIFNAEVCMVASSVLNQSQQPTPVNANGIFNGANPGVNYHIVVNDKSKTINFPGSGNTTNFEENIKSGVEQPNCGSVTWSSIAGPNTGDKAVIDSDKKAALSSMVLNLYSAAKSYTCANLTGAAGSSVCSGVSTDSSSIVPENQAVLYRTVLDYANIIYPVAQMMHEGAAEKAKAFIPIAKQQGWVLAGRYYWDLSQIASHYDQVGQLSSYLPSTATGFDKAISNDGPNGLLSKFLSQNNLSDVWSEYVFGGGAYSEGAMDRIGQYVGNQGGSDIYDGGSLRGGLDIFNSADNAKLFGIPNKISNDIIGGALMKLAGIFTAGHVSDPIVFLHKLGLAMIGVALTFFLVVGVVLTGGGLLAMFANSAVNGLGVLQLLAGWIKGPVMALGGLLIGVGFLLGFYLPAYPFILFTIGVIGWFVVVLEAMVAAPLIAFGLTHPEGHDFLGEAKQALMLLLSVFLRPVLMVIGLIAGMILSYVSLRLVLYTFSGFLSDIFAAVPSPAASGTLIGGLYTGASNLPSGLSVANLSSSGIILICFPIMLVILAITVYTVTVHCYRVAVDFPNYIISRYIGGPATDTNSHDLLRQVHGGFGQGGQMATRAAESGISEAEKGASRSESKAAQNNSDMKNKEDRGLGAHGEEKTSSHSDADPSVQ